MRHGSVESHASVSLLGEWRQESTRVEISAMPAEPVHSFEFSCCVLLVNFSGEIMGGG